MYRGNPTDGIIWENWFIERYGAARPSESLNTPFDFIWNENRIDLKTRNITDPKYIWWSFVGGKDCSKTCDFVVCLGIKYGKLRKVFKIPAKVFGKGVSIGCNHSPKFDKYRISLPK